MECHCKQQETYRTSQDSCIHKICLNEDRRRGKIIVHELDHFLVPNGGTDSDHSSCKWVPAGNGTTRVMKMLPGYPFKALFPQGIPKQLVGGYPGGKMCTHNSSTDLLLFFAKK